MLHGTQKYFTIVVLINVIPVYVEKTYIVNNKLRWYMVLKFQCGWNHCIKIVHLFTIKFLIKILKMSLYLSLTQREKEKRKREKFAIITTIVQFNWNKIVQENIPGM